MCIMYWEKSKKYIKKKKEDLNEFDDKETSIDSDRHIVEEIDYVVLKNE